MGRQEELEERNEIAEAVKGFWREEGRLTREGIRFRQEIFDLTCPYVYYCIHKIIKVPDLIAARMVETYHSVYHNLMNLRVPEAVKLWAGRIAMQHVCDYISEHEENYPLSKECHKAAAQLEKWKGDSPEEYHAAVEHARQGLLENGILIPVELVKEDFFFEQLSDLITESSMLERFLIVGFYFNELKIEQLMAQLSGSSMPFLPDEWGYLLLSGFEERLQEKLFPKTEILQGIPVASAMKLLAQHEGEKLKIPSALLDKVKEYFAEEYRSEKNRLQEEDALLHSYIEEEKAENTFTEDIKDLKEKLKRELAQVKQEAEKETKRKNEEVEKEIASISQNLEEKKKEERQRIIETRREEDREFREKLDAEQGQKFGMIFIIAAAVCCVIVIIIFAIMYDNMTKRLSGGGIKEGIPKSLSETEEKGTEKKETEEENAGKETEDVSAVLAVSEPEAYAMVTFLEELKMDENGNSLAQDHPFVKGERENSLRAALKFYYEFLQGQQEQVKQWIYPKDIHSFFSYYRGREEAYGILEGYTISQAFLLSDFNKFYQFIYGTEAQKVTEGEMKELNDENVRFQYVHADKMILYCIHGGKPAVRNDSMFYIKKIEEENGMYRVNLKKVWFAYGITSQNAISQEESFAYTDCDSFFEKQKLAEEYLSGKRTSVFFEKGEEREFLLKKGKNGMKLVAGKN